MSNQESSEGGLGEAPPESAAPSVIIYRGSIAALVIGSFIALFLVLQPPENETRAEPVHPEATNTPAISATATATPVGGRLTATVPPEAKATPTGIAPTPTPMIIEYTIIGGDTLSAIAEGFSTTVEAIMELNPGLDPRALSIGQIILVPPP